MGNRGSQLGGGRDSGDSDLELLRERVLDHADDEAAVSGHDIENNSSVGPVRVIVRQDGIGRTGGIVLGVFAGLAFGIAICSLVVMNLRDGDLRTEMRNTQVETRVMINHVMELEANQKAMSQEQK